MIKPIFKIVNYKLDIVGFYLYVDMYLHTPPTLFDKIKMNCRLPDEINDEIISYLPNNFVLVLRADLPNTFPINTLYVSFEKLYNLFLFPGHDFKEEIEYINHQIKKYNTKYSIVENHSNIDFEYLRAHSGDYLINEINRIFATFNRIQCVFV